MIGNTGATSPLGRATAQAVLRNVDPRHVELATSFGAATRGGFLGRVRTAVRDLTDPEPVRLATVVRAAVAA
ncbi:hypothetical protein AGRA3207_004589 [Actinomadura graeca]|uniref:Uncharacterized protein n=1 Tax=Actinomadura graeca TaxID=2750812 RepID=A0ABX8QYM3_9ACTN|nr:hypothetical protein [Actinomadura graeca]QXJ23441.1 hypothetical protein AGRA3207_004589 [Actinomadura graeca]